MKILFVSLFLPREKSYHAGVRYVYEIIKKNMLAKHEISLATRLEEKEIPLLKSPKTDNGRSGYSSA